MLRYIHYTILIGAMASWVMPSPLRASEAEGRVRDDAQNLFDQLDEMTGAKPAPKKPAAPKAEPPAPSPEPAPESAPAPALPEAAPEAAPAPAPTAETAGPSTAATSTADDAANRAEAEADLRAFVEAAAARAEQHRQHQAELKASTPAAAAVKQRVDDDDDDDEDDDDDDLDDARPIDLARERRLRIGLETHGALGLGHKPESLTVIGTGGLDVGINPTSFLTVGVGGIGLAMASLGVGDRWAMNATPYVEGFVFFGRHVQPYVQLGLPAQMRFGAGLPQQLGLAGYAGTGCRIWFGSRFSVGPVVRLHHVFTDGFLVSGQVLPGGTQLLTAGVDTHVHF
jgi:hypothetical protein